MKLVKKFVFALLFVSALAVNTYAGDMETPGYVPPPPPRSMSSTATTDETADASAVTGELGDSTANASDELLYEAFMAMLALF
jgi:hypothetical protein